jgi:hypothetical protein
MGDGVDGRSQHLHHSLWMWQLIRSRWQIGQLEMGASHPAILQSIIEAIASLQSSTKNNVRAASFGISGHHSSSTRLLLNWKHQKYMYQHPAVRAKWMRVLRPSTGKCCRAALRAPPRHVGACWLGQLLPLLDTCRKLRPRRWRGEECGGAIIDCNCLASSSCSTCQSGHCIR